MQKSFKQTLARRIAHLPPRYQQILALNYLEDLTLIEISKVMNLPVHRVYRLYLEALHLLASNSRQPRLSKTTSQLPNT